MSDFNECNDQEPCSGPELLGKLLEHLGLGEQNGNGAETYMIIHSGCEGLNPSNNVNYNFLTMLYQKAKSKNFPQEQFIILLLPKIIILPSISTVATGEDFGAWLLIFPGLAKVM